MDTKNSTNVPKIALLLDLQWEYPRRLLSGIARYASINGPWAFFQNSWLYIPTMYSENQHKAMLQSIKNWKPTGIIMRDDPLFGELLELNVPTITIIGHDENALGQPYIDLDDSAVAQMGINYLIEKGFYNLAFCGTSNFWSKNREAAFQKEALNIGIKLHAYEITTELLSNRWETEVPLNNMVDWLHTLPKPIGIMAAEDVGACQVIEACKLAGYAVPEQVSVIGVHNDSVLCSLSDPPLTSIALSDEKAGYLAAQTLDKMMKGEKLESRRILVEPSRVVARQSTDFFAAEDPVIAKAMHYIRENSKRSLNVSEVVECVPVSRRSLEVKFKEVLNRTVYEIIQAARIERICKMLIETDLSIKEIASILGFRKAPHMVRFFENEKKITPVVYREKFSNFRKVLD